jgi:hypothetical protein
MIQICSYNVIVDKFNHILQQMTGFNVIRIHMSLQQTNHEFVDVHFDILQTLNYLYTKELSSNRITNRIQLVSPLVPCEHNYRSKWQHHLHQR